MANLSISQLPGRRVQEHSRTSRRRAGIDAALIRSCRATSSSVSATLFTSDSVRIPRVMQDTLPLSTTKSCLARQRCKVSRVA